MSGQQFTFPPPPAPPQASQSYPRIPQAHNGHLGGASRGDRGCRGQGWGANRRGSRGGGNGPWPAQRGYPVDHNRQQSSRVGGHHLQGNGHSVDGYPLPNYPAVQLPQYPANLGQGYGRQPLDYPTNSPAVGSSRAGCPPYAQRSHQVYNGQTPYSSNQFISEVPFHSMAQTFQKPTSLPSGNARQSAQMGPPIRMGFDEYRQSCQQSSLPQFTASGTMPFQSCSADGDGSPYRQNPRTNLKTARHELQKSLSGHRGRGQKRGHGEAFGRQRNHNPRLQAAPAVPNFGGALPLPVKPPSSQDHARKPRKKKRKHNQLGLTPKMEEHESSEDEEDDADEESRLATVVTRYSAGSQYLQFQYKGRTSTLQSSSDIASWIEERRKRYPTKARATEAAERKQKRGEAQKAANHARREVEEKQKVEKKQNQRQKVDEERQGKQPKVGSEDMAAKAKRKVEKLRKQLEKEEKRAARAEAKVARQNNEHHTVNSEEQAALETDRVKRRKRTNSDGYGVERNQTRRDQPCLAINPHASGDKTNSYTRNPDLLHVILKEDSSLKNPQDQEQNSLNPMADPLTPMSQPAAPEDFLEPQHHFPGISKAHAILHGQLNDNNAEDSDRVAQTPSISKSDSIPEISSTDSGDSTSSSGSSSSNSNPDSDSGSPDEASSRRDGPEKVLPPRRERLKNICSEFLKGGRCKRGDNCQYRHELPQRGSRNIGRKADKKTQSRPERVGLHQRLVEQEKEKEDHEVLEAIIHLGEKGLLDQEASKPSAKE